MLPARRAAMEAKCQQEESEWTQAATGTNQIKGNDSPETKVEEKVSQVHFVHPICHYGGC